ncbi:hypothetical protein RJ639_031479 [Escallonia herrerae]|uniref:K Homology domain-containing protein n=1 Tax=Escallonia herrerae TaxID=1293975 RepID=A0AA88WYX0_9ASTE|nr:hypothetical protein RJ639_031479 [Escallonia herrerae]
MVVRRMAEENFDEQDNIGGNEQDNVSGDEQDNTGADEQENVGADDQDNVGADEQENIGADEQDNIGGDEQDNVVGTLEDSHHTEIPVSENDSGVPGEKKWPGWPGDNVFRLLVPVQKVGGIIGRKGEYIKKTCEETKARIKILDGPPGTTERTVMVSAKEEPDVSIPPAMDGLLKVHKRIVDVDTDPAHVLSVAVGTVCTRLLVAASQAGSLIGKQGATIKSIQDGSNCTIRVLGGDDSVVEVQGEPTGVHKAVELIASHLRRFLVDRSVVGIFETQMQMPNGRANEDMPPPPSWGPPQNFPLHTGGGPGFAPNSQYMPPPHQFDGYYPPADMPHLDKQPRQGPPAYGRDASMGHTASMQPQGPQQAMITKVSQHMQIPLSYADAVIGNSGANISYIRRASGATIAIQETRGTPGEMTVEINGSASQNSIAEVASAAQNPAAAPPGQGYNSYPGQGPMYGSQPSNTGGHAPAGDYGSVYGTNYGY